MPRLAPAKTEVTPAPKLFEQNSSLGSMGEKLFETKEQTENKEVEVEVKDGPTEETLVVEKVEPKKVEPEEDEATLRLQKQIEELKKSEELQRNAAAEANRQREEALRQAQAQQERLRQLEKEAQDSEEVAIGAALAAAKAESDKAQADLTAALNAGDNAAAGEAQRRLARAEARAVSLESGKDEIEQRKKAPPPPPQPEYRSQNNDPVDQFNLPPPEKQWLREHRDFLTDQRKWNAMQYISQKLALDGIRPGDSRFLPQFEDGLRKEGALPKMETEVEEEEVEREEPVRERRIVSAPVSRETSSSRSRSKITLTPQEREMARLSGITEVEYAKQKQKLRDLQETGAEEYTRSRYGDR